MRFYTSFIRSVRSVRSVRSISFYINPIAICVNFNFCVEVCVGVYSNIRPMCWLFNGSVNYNMSSCIGDHASISVHVSTNEYSALADLVELILPQALQTSIYEQLAFRQSLPRNVGEYMGVSSVVMEEEDEDSDDEGEEAEEIGVDTSNSNSNSSFVEHVEVVNKRIQARELKKRLSRERIHFKNKVMLLLNQVVTNTMDMLDVGIDQVQYTITSTHSFCFVF